MGAKDAQFKDIESGERKLEQFKSHLEYKIAHKGTYLQEKTVKRYSKLLKIIIDEIIPMLVELTGMRITISYQTDTLSEDTSVPVSVHSLQSDMSTYRAKLSTLDANFDSPSYQRVCNLLNLFFTCRYDPNNSPERYRTDSIADWIDMLIIYIGANWTNGKFNEVCTNLEAWYKSLGDPDKLNRKDYVPYDCYAFSAIVKHPEKYLSASMITEDAILLEKLIKPHLYSNTFYPDKLTSIASLKDKYPDISPNLLENWNIDNY